MTKRRKSQGIEWVGGLISLPGYVTGEGEPYRPELLIWLIADGPIVGHSLAKPGELLARAARSFRETLRAPQLGGRHAPSRLRVASPELASVLREELPPTIELVCAPTPELDDVIAAFLRHSSGRPEVEPSYLLPGVDEDAVAALFHAAARLFRANPWGVVPSDMRPILVTSEPLRLRDAALSIIGQSGESFGFLLFYSRADFDRYARAADAAARGEGRPKIPKVFSLNFERGADLAPALRKEIARHGWEVVSADAYPWLLALDEDACSRPLNANDVKVAEAISLALSDVLAKKRSLLAAWRLGNAFTRTVRVAAHAGEIQVTLSTT